MSEEKVSIAEEVLRAIHNLGLKTAKDVTRYTGYDFRCRELERLRARELECISIKQLLVYAKLLDCKVDIKVAAPPKRPISMARASNAA